MVEPRMTNEPMSTNELADLREPDSWMTGDFTQGEALLAAHDYWRARVRPQAEDVKRMGVTRARVTAWLTEHGWTESLPEGQTWPRTSIWRVEPRDARGVSVYDEDKSELILESVLAAAHHHGLGHWELLDQLALIELSSQSSDPNDSNHH